MADDLHEATTVIASAGTAEDPPRLRVPREELERRARDGLALVDGVARSVARRFNGKVPLDDLRSHGSSALLEIAETWDEARAKFSSYAQMKLKWAMLDGVRRDRRGRASARAGALLASERYAAESDGPAPGAGADPPTEEAYQARLTGLLEGHAAALAMGLAAGAVEGGIEEDSAEEKLLRAQFAEVVRGAVGALDARPRALVERHYFGGEQFDAIARDLGISKSWASRIHAQAMGTLAERLKGARG